MKKLLLLLFGFSPSLLAVGAPIGYVQISTNALTPQAGGFNTSSGTVGVFTVTGLAANQCVQTTAGGQLAVTGSNCSAGGGGGSGASVLGVNFNGVSVTSPTAQINFLGPPFLVSANGSTSTVKIDGSSVTMNGPNVINLTSALQSGATFYVSSGTVDGSLYTNSNVEARGKSVYLGTSAGTAYQLQSKTSALNSCTINGIITGGCNNVTPQMIVSTWSAGPNAQMFLDSGGRLSVGNQIGPNQLNVTGTAFIGNSGGAFPSVGVSELQVVGAPSATYSLLVGTGVVGGKTIGISTSSEINLNGSVGTNGQVLTSAGVGTAPTWTTPSAGGGSPGGSSGQLQWNNANVFAGAVNTIVTGSSITFNEPITANGLSDPALTPNQPVITDANKQLISGNIPLASVSGILAVANGGTSLGSASNNAVLLGNGSAWTAGVEPSCSGSGNALTFNTGTNVFGCNTVAVVSGSNYNVQFASAGVLNGATFLNVWSSSMTNTGSGGLGVTYGVTAGSATFTGAGNGVVTITVNGVPYTAVFSSITPVVGNTLVFSSTNGAVNNGGLGSQAGGTSGQIQWNNSGTLAGALSAMTSSSSTILSSMTISNGGPGEPGTPLLAVTGLHTAEPVNFVLFSVGSDNENAQFKVPDLAPAVDSYGIAGGCVSVGAKTGSATNQVYSCQTGATGNDINLWTGEGLAGELAIETNTSAPNEHDITLRPALVTEVRVSTLGVTISTSMLVTGFLTTTSSLSVTGVGGSSVTYGESVGSFTVTNRNYMSGGVVYSSSFSSVNASSSTGVTNYVKSNLSAQITPKFTTSRIKITVSGQIAASGALSAECDVSISTTGTIITSLATNPLSAETDIVAGQTGVGNGSFMWVDSPNTISAVTYTVIIKGAGTTPTCAFNSGSATGTASLFVEDIGPQ